MTIKFHYFGDTSKAYTNVITIASELTKQIASDDVEYQVIRFGFSLSNSKDRYSKQLGKHIAISRFNTEPYRVILGGTDHKPTFNGIIDTMLNHIITETIVPEWVETIVGKYL
jgi:hypothetical protein